MLSKIGYDMAVHGLVLLLLLSVIFNAYAQSDITEEIMAVIEIKTDVEMKNIYQRVKRYDYSPRYLIDYSSVDCTYRIEIGGVEALEVLSPGTVGGAVEPINGRLLKSGKYKIKIILTPPRNQEWEFQKFLTNHSSLKFSIKHGEFGKDKMEDYEVVYTFESPKIKKDGIASLEFEGDFYLEVPYVLEGWSNSKDLRKIPSIKNDVLATYHRYLDIAKNKDTIGYANMMYKKEQEVAQAFFWDTQKDSEERWDDLVEEIVAPGEFELIENYEMRFLADGKVVELIRNDEDYKGEPVIRRIHDGSIVSYPLYLHMLKGSDKLEVIR